MSSEFILTNAQIVTADAIVSGTVRIVDVKVADIAAGPTQAAGTAIVGIFHDAEIRHQVCDRMFEIEPFKVAA